jgi:hypothetical protein
MNIQELAGKKIVAIDIVDDPKKDHEIRIEIEGGRVFRFYHNQDCCESVRIAAPKDSDGSLLSLIGKEIREVTQEEDRDDGTDTDYDSWTKTTITFRTDSETVISRWIGESNGYYSEDVDLEEVFKGGAR